jgi:hypothetical protein
MAPVSLPDLNQHHHQQQPTDTNTDMDLASDNDPLSTNLARKRASVHIIEGKQSRAKALVNVNSNCYSIAPVLFILSC